LHIDQDESESNSSAIKLLELKEKSEYDHIKFEKVIDADVEEAIIKYASNNNVDILSVITYTTTLFKKWFHQSLTEKLSKHSTIPLLVYNRKEFDVIFLG
jgi:nucleotide-binding universal stress UspA family protein